MLASLQRYPVRSALMVVLVVIGFFLFWQYRDELSADRLIAWGESIPLALFLASFLVLPLLGVPLSVFLILAGMRFGLLPGFLISAGCIFFHNVVALSLTRSAFRGRLISWLEERGRAIPDFDRERQVYLTALFALVAGPPYALKLYLLALTNVSTKVYLWVGGVCHSLLAVVPLLAGTAATEINPLMLFVVLTGAFVLTVLFRRLWRGFRERRTREEPLV
ncbi:MAG: hypothetical protein Q7Q71_05690 [Verrucomicrobiota bacterium JB023]|nr:hypothetical protein [Verrucomicrobiota bacterium JB023]